MVGKRKPRVAPLDRCAYCRDGAGKIPAIHNGRGGHLNISLRSILGLTRTAAAA